MNPLEEIFLCFPNGDGNLLEDSGTTDAKGSVL